MSLEIDKNHNNRAYLISCGILHTTWSCQSVPHISFYCLEVGIQNCLSFLHFRNCCCSCFTVNHCVIYNFVRRSCYPVCLTTGKSQWKLDNHLHFCEEFYICIVVQAWRFIYKWKQKLLESCQNDSLPFEWLHHLLLYNASDV
jgi:hypothetical protein